MEAKKYLTELIDYERDISPYRTILLKSPPGSGKNYFVAQLAKKESVMLVTSRRNIVDQTLSDDELFSWKVAEPEKSVVMTMSRMTAIYESVFNQGPKVWEDKKLWPWEVADIVVIDECHALMMDATFTAAPPHVMDVLEAFASSNLPINKKLILTSATVDCIEETLRHRLGGIHPISKATYCKRVLPQSISWTNQDSIKQDIFEKVRAGEKTILFYQGELMQVDRFLGAEGEDLSDCAVSIYSDAEALKNLEETNRNKYKQTLEVMEAIKTTGLLPDWVKLVICTSKWREGININNPDVRWLFIDTCIKADIIQYCGRLRKSSFGLVLNHDAYQFEDSLIASLRDMEESKAKIKELNEEYKLTDDKAKLVNDVEKDSLWVEGESMTNDDYRDCSGIYFDWFSGQFRFNAMMWQSLQYRLRCIKQYQSLNRVSDTSYSDWARKIFDNQVSNVDKLLLPEYEAMRIYKKYKFVEGKTYSPEKINNFIAEINNKVWPDIKTINTIMRNIQPNKSTILLFKSEKVRNSKQYRLIRKAKKPVR